jgi:CMP/dCMP kinase
MIPVITIDGPSGAGKGTISRLLSQQLGFNLLDSGSLYRLTALSALQRSVGLNDESALANLADALDISFRPETNRTAIWLSGTDVTLAIREEAVGMGASQVAALPLVRAALLERQRAFAIPPGLVADGRDMGTVVFPGAPLKIFLTASARARAQRRLLQLEQTGVSACLDTITADIEARDALDSSRPISPLKPANDAHLIDSTQMSIDEVLGRVAALWRLREPTCSNQ